MVKDYQLTIDSIIEAIVEIINRTKAVNEIAYSQDKLLQDAILMQFVLIGEGAKKVPNDIRALSPEIEWKSVVGLRNIIIHDYAKISMNKTWDTIVHDLPKLKSQLTELRSKLPDVTPRE